MFFLATNSFAQDGNFASDRPGLSDAPDLINKRTCQLATGFDISDYNHYGVYQLSTNTLKYGICNRLEARLDFAFQYDHNQKKFGVTSPSLGLKVLLFNQKKVLPKAAFIVEYYPPAFTGIQPTHGLAAELCFNNNIKKRNALYYNAGVNWQDVTTKIPTVNALLGYQRSFTDKFNAFIEFYFFKKPTIQMNYVVDLGITYQFTKKLQADFAFGLDLVHPNGNLYFDGGITYNF